MLISNDKKNKCLIEFAGKAIWSWIIICSESFDHAFSLSICDWSVHIFYFFLVQS